MDYLKGVFISQIAIASCEKIIMNAFVESIDLRDAIKKISTQFDSFDENECVEYIEKLISAGILIEC